MEELFVRLQAAAPTAPALHCQRAVNAVDGDVGLLMLKIEGDPSLDDLRVPINHDDALAAAVQEQKQLMRWQVDVDDIEERERAALRGTAAAAKDTKCPKCGGKLHYKSVQMRSGDEPATVFRICLLCSYNDVD